MLLLLINVPAISARHPSTRLSTRHAWTRAPQRRGVNEGVTGEGPLVRWKSRLKVGCRLKARPTRTLADYAGPFAFFVLEAGEDSVAGYSLEVGAHCAYYFFVDIRYYYVEGVAADGIYAPDEVHGG